VGLGRVPIRRPAATQNSAPIIINSQSKGFNLQCH
jgi:hypothetical protein